MTSRHGCNLVTHPSIPIHMFDRWLIPFRPSEDTNISLITLSCHHTIHTHKSIPSFQSIHRILHAPLSLFLDDGRGRVLPTPSRWRDTDHVPSLGICLPKDIKDMNDWMDDWMNDSTVSIHLLPVVLLFLLFRSFDHFQRNWFFTISCSFHSSAHGSKSTLGWLVLSAIPDEWINYLISETIK